MLGIASLTLSCGIFPLAYLSKTPRYALIPDDQNDVSVLNRLEVEPIRYPNADGRHSALPRLLNAWAEWKSMGQDDHQDRIKRLVSLWENDGDVSSEGVHYPTLSVVDEDYLRKQVSKIDGARLFASQASTMSWLKWADKLPDFESLFVSGGELTDVALVLADWFVNRYVAVSSLSAAAMSTLEKHEQTAHSDLIEKIRFAAYRLDKDDPRIAQKWRVILATSIHGYSAPRSLAGLLPFEDQALQPYGSMARQALIPYLRLHPSLRFWAEDGNAWPRVTPAWRLDEHDLKKYLENWIVDQPEGSTLCLEALEWALLSVYELLDAYNDGAGRGAFEMGRSAIEPHSQDRREEVIDVIINYLRDLGVEAADVLPALHERWWGYGYGLFRRLAVHLVGKSSELTADQKIGWLIDRHLLYDHVTRHETFQVLEGAASKASSDMHGLLLAEVLAGGGYGCEPNGSDRTSEYERFNLLVWLTRIAPAWTQASSALTRIKSENRDFTEREHPDFSMWISAEAQNIHPIMPPEEFNRRIREDPETALISLMDEGQTNRGHEDDPFNEEFALIRASAADAPWEGTELWNTLDSVDMTEERRRSFRRALVYGWSKAKLEDTGPVVIEKVASVVLEQDSVEAVAAFLLQQSRNYSDGKDSDFLVETRRLAIKIWELYRESFDPPSGLKPSDLALNTWPGDLVYFWVSQIQRRWREEGNNWLGFNEEESSALKSMLEGPSAALEAIWPVFGSELYFFDAADHSFADEYILPLFGQVNSRRQVWEPFLFHPQTNMRMLRAGLLEAIITTFEMLGSLDLSGMEGRFISFTAAVAVYGGIDKSDRGRILDATVNSENGAYAGEFAGAVVEQLRDGNEDASKVWKSWLHHYLLRRLDGVPREITKVELLQWAEVVPVLGGNIEQGTALFKGRQIGFADVHFNPEYVKESLLSHGEMLVAYYTDRVQNTEPNDFLLNHRIQRIVRSLRDDLGDVVARPLINAAKEKGFVVLIED